VKPRTLTPPRYRKISYHDAAIERTLVDIALGSRQAAPATMIDIGAQVIVSVRRVHVAMADPPSRSVFAAAHARL
jgi:hypothetical protein